MSSTTCSIPPVAADRADTASTVVHRSSPGREGALAIVPLVVAYVPFALVIGAAAAERGAPVAGWAGSWLILGGQRPSGGAPHARRRRPVDRDPHRTADQRPDPGLQRGTCPSLATPAAVVPPCRRRTHHRSDIRRRRATRRLRRRRPPAPILPGGRPHARRRMVGRDGGRRDRGSTTRRDRRRDRRPALPARARRRGICAASGQRLVVVAAALVAALTTSLPAGSGLLVAVDDWCRGRGACGIGETGDDLGRDPRGRRGQLRCSASRRCCCSSVWRSPNRPIGRSVTPVWPRSRR